MTPKEKAKDLIDKFSTRLKVLHELEGWVEHIDSSNAKAHALVAVNLLLNDKHKTEDFYETYYFWQEVKKEIEKL